MTPDQLSQLIQACFTPTQHSLTAISSPTAATFASPSNPAYFHNAKYEDICCKAIKPIYDGTEADLMPFLLRLDIHQQDEGWAPATYITIKEKTYDLTCKFTMIKESSIIASISHR
jgi:hypothetical protein